MAVAALSCVSTLSMALAFLLAKKAHRHIVPKPERSIPQQATSVAGLCLRNLKTETSTEKRQCTAMCCYIPRASIEFSCNCWERN